VEEQGLIFDIKRDCSEDGPGIRTVIFFKGCPLSCSWCQNPEGLSPLPSLSYDPELCDPGRCGGYPCVEVCQPKALTIDPGGHKIKVDRDACSRCDACFEVCRPKALEPVGQWWSVAELVEKVLVDRDYFRSTGGGVTLSGGEPTLQMGFLQYFLPELKKEEIGIGLETCGLFNLERFRKSVLPFLDFIYFDLKLIDPDASRRYTGASNETILGNFLSLHHDSAIAVIPRIPLIPDITTTESNLDGFARFLQRHGVKGCSLMPYNPLWGAKARKNGIAVKYSRSTFMTREEEERCVRCFSGVDKGAKA